MRPAPTFLRVLAIGATLATEACADDVGRLAGDTACDLSCTLKAVFDPEEATAAGVSAAPKPPTRKPARPRPKSLRTAMVQAPAKRALGRIVPATAEPAAGKIPPAVPADAEQPQAKPSPHAEPAAQIPGSAPPVAPSFGGSAPPKP